MLYSTGSYHVLGAALSEVTGKTLLSLARDRLGTPLGIEFPAWTRGPAGILPGRQQHDDVPHGHVPIWGHVPSRRSMGGTTSFEQKLGHRVLENANFLPLLRT